VAAGCPAPALSLLNLPEVSKLTGSPCVEIPQMGSSPDVMRVADDKTIPPLVP